MNSLDIAASATLALGAMLCYAAVIFWIGCVSGLFKRFTPLQALATCIALAPMALSWTYGSVLRLAPSHAPQFYLIVVIAIAAPFAAWSLVACVRKKPNLYRTGLRWSKRPWIERSAPMLLIAVLIAFSAIALSANIRLPVATNDPMEYFTVARAIFEHQRISGIYPILDENVSNGFYGPWTHPPGYVLIIAWLYLCQGTAAVAGIAKIFNVYAAVSLALVTWAWSGGPFRWSSVISTLLVLLIPLVMWEVFDMHVDVARLAVWTSIICIIPMWLGGRTLATSLAFGILAGLALFIHSLGVLFFGFLAGLLLLLQSGRLSSRLKHGLLVSAIAILMVLPDYAANYAHYGYLIGDSVPLWEIKSLDLASFLNEQRALGTMHQKVINGVFGALAKPTTFGWTTIAFAVCLFFYLIALVLPRRGLQALFEKLTKPTLINTLTLSMGAFLALLVLSVALGSNTMIKNARYIATMSALAGIAAALMADKILFWLGERRWWRLPSPGYIYVPIAVVLSWTLLDDAKGQSSWRLGTNPIDEAHISDPNVVLTCNPNPALQLVSKINTALATTTDRKIKVLAFFPAGSAYYGKYPIVSYLDPKLLPAFLAPSSQEAFAALRSLGITHILLPPYKMGEIEKTVFRDLLKDDKYFQIEASIDGNQLLTATGIPPLFSKQQSGPISVSFGNPVLFEATSDKGLITDGGTDLKCAGSVSTEGGTAYLTLDRKVVVTTGRQIAVDIKKQYRLSFDMRVPQNNPEANVFVGLATYDANGAVETEEPGTHRYGVLSNANIKPSSEWKHYSGVFSGSGNTVNQFRAGTKTVAPIFLLNYYNPEKSTIQIRNISFEQLD